LRAPRATAVPLVLVPGNRADAQRVRLVVYARRTSRDANSERSASAAWAAHGGWAFPDCDEEAHSIAAHTLSSAAHGRAARLRRHGARCERVAGRRRDIGDIGVGAGRPTPSARRALVGRDGSASRERSVRARGFPSGGDVRAHRLRPGRSAWASCATLPVPEQPHRCEREGCRAGEAAGSAEGAVDHRRATATRSCAAAGSAAQAREGYLQHRVAAADEVDRLRRARHVRLDSDLRTACRRVGTTPWSRAAARCRSPADDVASRARCRRWSACLPARPAATCAGRRRTRRSRRSSRRRGAPPRARRTGTPSGSRSRPAPSSANRWSRPPAAATRAEARRELVDRGAPRLAPAGPRAR